MSFSFLDEGNEDSIFISNKSVSLVDESFLDSDKNLKNIRLKNSNRLIIAQLNINSLRNKFDFLVQIMSNNVDLFLVSETKIDSSFPNAQFHIAGYTMYRRDRNLNGGGILLYIKEDIPSSLLMIDNYFEAFYVEINIRKRKWLIGCTYNPKSSLISTHLDQIGKNLDKYMLTYSNFLLLGDLNAEPTNPTVHDFCQVNSCNNLIHENTCFKNPQNPSCIDLMLTNMPKSFQSSLVLEKGLSDFHKMTLTVMKVFYKKQNPNIIKYRNYKNFDNNSFMIDVKDKISQISGENEISFFDLFKNKVFQVFENHVPLKTRYVRANQAPFITKKLSKEIMIRTRLRNKFFKTKKETDREKYNKQRNYCVSLIRKEKNNYFSNINTRDITDNKRFWKTVKPLFTDKIPTKSKITLIEKKVITQDDEDDIITEDIISDDKTVSEVFNDFFVNIVSNLDIKSELDFETTFIKSNDPVADSIRKFQTHPSIVMINNKNYISDFFTFDEVQFDNVLEKIEKLDNAKTSQQTDIPTKLLKQNSRYFADIFSKNINNCFENSNFPTELKLADVIPVYKKKSKNFKDNYRPVSILPNISKIYERVIYEQMQPYFENLLSKFQCGFRKGYNAQHCLMVLIEKWKKCVDNGGAFGALLTDLSKAFDCLSHELLIAKLNAYGFDKKSLTLVYSYLSKRKQRVKINNSFSSWQRLSFGVPQGSILGPLLFNIYICDMFYFLENYDIANYADDTTPFSVKQNHDLVVEDLQNSSAILFKWLKDNYMKINTDKSHLIMSRNKSIVAKIDEFDIQSENQQELLGIVIDSNLTFEDHVSKICKKASQKLNALARVSSYMDIHKKKLLMKSFITSQFGYCPLIWMFHSRTLNKRINSIHERSLRITYSDKVSTFQELLEKDNSVSIHQRNLQILATEMFKVYKNISPELLNDIFEPKESCYRLRANSFFKTRKVTSVHHGTESLSFLGPKVWDLVPLDIKQSENIDIFKSKIKRLSFPECPCRLCKIFIPQLGFI